MQGQKIDVTTYAKRPNWTRTELTVSGKLVINGFDGAVAWIINPLAGLTTPVLVSGPQADMIRDQPGIVGALVDYKSQGYTIEVEGMENIGDRNVFHLRLTSRKKQISHVYLDATTFLEAKISSDSDQFKLDQEFADYRDVDGVKWPFQIRMLANGVMQSEIKVLTVEFNTPIDDAMFRVPKGS
jgi:outer membrane lipoprotein-sorting protein